MSLKGKYSKKVSQKTLQGVFHLQLIDIIVFSTAVKPILALPPRNMDYITKTANFSSCLRYRYNLVRRWRDNSRHILFVGLNPSIADDNIDDPTTRRCIKFAKLWGYGSMELVNLFSYCATDPRDLIHQPDPIGPKNDSWIQKANSRSDITIACWGSFIYAQNRATQITNKIKKLHCLRINRNYSPAHPLYLPLNLRPLPYIKQQITSQDLNPL